MSISRVTGLALALFFLAVTVGLCEEPGRKTLRGMLPPVLSRQVPIGQLPAATNLSLAIGLPLRDPAGLDRFLAEVYDPASPNFRKYLSPAEFTARFGPTESDYEAVKEFARTNGFTITGTCDSRLLVDVRGSAAVVEKAFHVTLRTYHHPNEARDFYAPETEPSVAAGLPVADVQGLTDYYRFRPRGHKIDPSTLSGVVPKSGSAPDGYSYFGDDFRNAYAPGTALTGAGQMVGLLQFDGFYSNDIAAYATAAGGGRDSIAIQTVLIDGFSGTPSSAGSDGNAEVSLDIEMTMAMAPGLAKIVVFEAPNSTANFNDILNAMASTNTYPLLNNLSCSWGGGGPSSLAETIFKKMAAQGQSFFSASGDSDAFTGSVPFPSESTNITQVGGTTLSMNGSGSSYASETTWNRGDGVGSSGGISTTYGLPYWQQGISMTANGGSTTKRNIPDVALTADYCYVSLGNGSSGSYGGTSCAAPLWAGFMALVNQQAAEAGLPPAGFINPAVYAIGKSSAYTSCFNDITTGNNYWSSSPAKFPAVAGYDLCTGWGTPNGTNLIDALASPLPLFLIQPAGKNVVSGNNVTFSTSVGRVPPFSYTWFLNGTSLSDGGNVSGSTSATLSITAATTGNAGTYSLVVTNLYGATTSSPAILNVGFVPTISVKPSSFTNLIGGDAAFSATVGGSFPQVYQWRHNGTNIPDGGVFSGVTTTNLVLTAITTSQAGNYSLVASNLFGSTTGSAGILKVVLPPTITGGIGNRAIECGSNTTFTVTASGTTPLSYRWSVDGTPASGATGSSFTLTNVHLPSHTVSVMVTNFYASATSNALLTVNDTKAPVIAIIGGNPMFIELGAAFNDPGATGSDVCAGSLPVSASGIVNTNVIGTNAIVYTADDGNGNTNRATRNVVVRDTTPPAILWSFTNLVLAANTNCSAIMPDVSATNFILATDLSGALAISQNPANNALLALGTNRIVITVQDTSANKAFSTNTIVVQDQTPPLISGQPQSRTNIVGATVNFSALATACTPVSYQWFFNDAILLNQTNNVLTLPSVGFTNAGNYTVVVSADGGVTPSAVATLTVDLIPTSLALYSSNNPSGYRDDLNLTAVVSPADAAGSVEFFTNAASFDVETLVAGTAISPNLSSLPRGTNFVLAIYSGDTSHLSATNTLIQIVTNHPPVAAGASYSYVSGIPLEIEVADLATNWSDPDGDPVLLASIGVSTNGVTLTEDAGTLVYFNAGDAADKFVCTISDGWDTNLQTVNLVATAPVSTTPSIIGSGSNPDGTINLSLAGAPGHTYVLESTRDLVPIAGWQPVATNTIDTNGVWNFTDVSATNFPQQFYRLKLEQ